VPSILANGIEQVYQIRGKGQPLVLVHGGFVDSRMWEPQVDYFATDYQVITYDLRGHGETGETTTKKYSMELYADDLKALLDELGIDQVILCGLSLGGMIAQAFAVKYPRRLLALVLSDTAVSVSLTLSDKIQRYVLFPKWLMLLTIRMMNVQRFVEYSFWLAKWTRSLGWFGHNEETMEYVKATMLNTSTQEYLKIYDAIYDFDLLDLGAISVPTLILNGEHESKSVLRHTEEMRRLIPKIETHIVPGAGHTSNMENPEAFNGFVDDFLGRVLSNKVN
jgi:non-heme chloroperoxidase